MTTLDNIVSVQRTDTTSQRGATYPQDSKRLDWLVAIFSTWIVAGLFLDGWAHNTFRGEIETFLTPWHAVLYSGFAVTGGLIVFTYARNLSRGYRWTQALPRGYMLSLLGVGIFGLSGGADFLWHNLFGFEVDTEALLSPAHVALATGGVLMISSPLRAIWARSASENGKGWRTYFPIILSLLSVLSVFTFFTQFSNAFTHANVFILSRPTEDSYFWDVTVLSSILVPTGLITGFIFLTIRRWSLPAGSLTFVLTGNAVLMFLLGTRYSSHQWPVLVAALAGGVFADVLLITLKPGITRVSNVRLFGFVVPFALFIFYFVGLGLTGNVWWRIHMWLGAPFLAGIIGLGMSFVAVPPTIPNEQ